MAEKFVTCEIKGLAEIQKRLEELAGPAAKKAMRAALKEGAAPILREMQDEAPRESGFLAENFGTKISVKQGGVAGAAYVGVKGKVYYPEGHERTVHVGGKSFKTKRLAAATVARFHEFGTRFMAAKPFMSRALVSKQAAALDRMIAAFKKTLGL